jgi:polar amino acid transport system substrate-binding protein
LLVLAAGVTLITACGRSRSRALARIQAAGVMRVAVDPSFPPFAYVDGTGTLVGYDVALARALASRLEVEAHFVTTGYDALYDALTVGRADVIISALYPDLSRSHAFAYSAPYFNAGDVLVVRPDRAIERPADLAGGTVLCQFGTTGHMEALTWQETLTPAPAVVPVEDPGTRLDDLVAGAVDAFVVDHVTALGLVAGRSGLRIVHPPVTDEPYVVAARMEDQGVIEAVDDALVALEAEGTMDALEAQWMVGP